MAGVPDAEPLNETGHRDRGIGRLFPAFPRRVRSLLALGCAVLLAAAATTACSSTGSPETTIELPPSIVSTGDPVAALTAAEREWCSFTGASEEDALRFDQIFEAGLALDLKMDVVNAFAAGLREEYEAAGMSPDEAVKAVSNEMLVNADFATACKAAYAQYG